MGSKSKSSTNTQTETNTFNNVDYGGDSVGSGSQLLAKNINAVDSNLSVGDISVSMTDHGAVEAGAGIATKSIEANQQITMGLLDSADNLFTRAYGDVEDSRELASNIAENSKDFATHIADKSFESNEYALQFLGQNVERSLAAVKSLTTSENAELTSKLITYGGLGVLVLGGLVVFAGNK